MTEKTNKFESFFKSFKETDELLDFKFAHETVGQKLPVISTGSIALDDALSSGGLPKGRLIQYYGAPGSGKSLLAMIAILNAQREDPDAQQVFIDSEQTFSPDWAAQLGLDNTRILLVEGDTAVNGVKCFEMLLGVPKEDAKTKLLKGKSKEGLLDKICNKEFNINLIVLDSLGAIIPPGEDTSRVGKMNMALLARFLTPTFRKLSLEVNRANVPFIIINHKRDNMDPYGVDHTYTGGNSYSHFLSANVYFTAIQRADAKILDDKENKVGHAMRGSIEKSKFGPYPKSCEFKVHFGIGIVDEHESVIQLAVAYDVIKKPDNSHYEYGEQKWHGAAKVAEAVKASPELEKELRLKIEEARDNKWKKKLEEQEVQKTKVLEESEKKRGRKKVVEDNPKELK